MDHSPIAPGSQKRTRRSRILLPIFIFVLICVALVSLGSNYYFLGQLDKTTKKLYAQTTLNSFGQTIIEKGGDLACANQVHIKTKNLFGDDKTGAYLFNASPQDVSFSVEDIRPEGSVSYISVDVSGYKKNTCGITTETVTHWIDECALVAKKIFGDMTMQKPLKERIYHLSSDKETASLFLIPVQNGCISIKKEL